MAGRPRKPTALRILQGDFEKDPKRRNKREPKPKSGRPTCPKHIKGIARAEWNRVIKNAPEGVITKESAHGLEQYVTAYESWRKALAYFQENGHDRSNSKSLLDNANLCHKWLIEFGLTPASRTRIQITNETDTASDKAKKYLA